MAYEIKRGDTWPPFEAQLTSNGDPVDLTNSTDIVLVIKPVGVGTTPVRRDAGTVGDPTEGNIEYQWVSADTLTAGAFQAEVEVTWTGGGIETFPNGGTNPYFDITVVADLG